MPRKAALKASKAIDEPNLIIPLATSYNERGVAGYTHAVTNSEDQRKVNCFYELAKNAMTGKGTLTLAKRPGVTIDSVTYGSSGQTAYLALDLLNAVNVQKAIFNKSGTTSRSSAPAGNSTILVSASYFPAFVDITSLSNVQNVVVQLRDSTSLGVVQRVFFNTVNGVSIAGAWTEIVDADFTAIIHRGRIEHIDGFAFILSDTNLIWNSDVNSLANWTATSFLAKQIRQDISVGLARLGNQLLAFGDNTVEMFFNNGNTTGSPLGRLAHLHHRIGLIRTALDGGTNYYATLQDKIYFVGRRSGQGNSSVSGSSIGVFAYDGQRFEKVSTPYIDKILSEKSNAIYSVNALLFQGQSGITIALTSPGTSPQRFLVFFPDWREWFEWTSTVFAPVNDGEEFLGLGSNQHRLYRFNATDNWQDNGTSYQWFTQFKLPTNGAARRFMPMYGVDADTDTSANDLTVEISTNDSATFSTLGTIDQTQDRKVLFRGGSFRHAHIRLGNTNARPTRIHNFLARIE